MAFSRLPQKVAPSSLQAARRLSANSSKGIQTSSKTASALLLKHAKSFDGHVAGILKHPALAPPHFWGGDNTFASVKIHREASKQHPISGEVLLEIRRENGENYFFASAVPKGSESNPHRFIMQPGDLVKFFPPGTVEPKVLQTRLADLLGQLGNSHGHLAPTPQHANDIGLSGKRALAGLNAALKGHKATGKVSEHWKEFSRGLDDLQKQLKTLPRHVQDRLTTSEVFWALPINGKVMVNTPQGPDQVTGLVIDFVRGPDRRLQAVPYATGVRGHQRLKMYALSGPESFQTKGTQPPDLEKALRGLLRSVSHRVAGQHSPIGKPTKNGEVWSEGSAIIKQARLQLLQALERAAAEPAPKPASTSAKHRLP